MPPKKKGTKSAKGKSSAVVDGQGNEDEQVEEQVIRIHEQLDRERRECAYFQVERNTIHTFWELAKKQLKEKNADNRSREREIEEAEEKHLTDFRVYKQKFKHLLYEQHNSIAELKTEGVVDIQIKEKEQEHQENELQRGLHKLKVYLKEQELNHKNLTKELNLKQDGEITRLRETFEAKLQEIEAAFEKKMQKQRQEQDVRRKAEIREIEQRKSMHINKLIKNHEKAFHGIKNYYSDLIPDSASQINSLTEEVAEMKKMKGRLKQEMARARQQNKCLTEKLEKATQEVSQLQKQLANYKKDKALLAGMKAHLKVANKELKDITWEHEVLQQIFSKVHQEHDELHQKFRKAILEVQQKSSFTKLLLEKKLDALTDTLEKKEAQFNEVLAASNLEPSALNMVTRKLEEVLDLKNTVIRDLQCELAQKCEAHNDLLRRYKVKLESLGIPADDVGVKPLESSLMKQTLVLDLKNTVIRDLQCELAQKCEAHNDLLRRYKVKLESLGIPADDVGVKPLESSLMKQTLGQ